MGEGLLLQGLQQAVICIQHRHGNELFQRQFQLMRRFVDLDIDLYGYATFTTPSVFSIREDMKRFVDDLRPSTAICHFALSH